MAGCAQRRTMGVRKLFREKEMKYIYAVAVSIGLLMSTIVIAQPIPLGGNNRVANSPAVSGNDDVVALGKTLGVRFAAIRPDLTVSSIEPTPVQGLYTVEFTNGLFVYSSADGEYFFTGKLFQLAPDGFVDVRDQALEPERAKALAAVDQADMIIFSPAEPPKGVINVFTDVDCYYCQKLHKEIDDILKAGIEVRYLAFPRSGIGSDSYKKIVSAWCADDRNAALTKLKNRQRIPVKMCPKNPVADQYNLGQKLGVTGTPALITDNGQLLPGYMPAYQLAQVLGIDLSPELARELAQKAATHQ